MVAVLTALSMPALFFIQLRLPDQGAAWAFYPAGLAHGEWTGVLTSMFLHFNWAHVAANAIGALTFGAPVARLMRGGRGVAAYLCFYMAGGVVAALGYGLLHLDSPVAVVGASGAVFALIGAATRLLGARGAVRPLTDRRALTMAGAWMGVNALAGLIGFAPGSEGAGVAWEAHAAGFVFGYLAIGPLGRLFRAPPFTTGFARSPWVGDPE